MTVSGPFYEFVMINKNIFCRILFALLCINASLAIADSTPVTTPASTNWLKKQMNLDCNSRSLNEVLEDVAAFFQTEIVYQAEGAEVPRQCRYSLLTVEQILDRLFQKENRAILIEYAPKRKIIVQVFGVSEYNIISDNGRKDNQSLPFLADMTNEALSAMQNEQLKAYHEELQDVNAIIPGVGLSRAEVAKLHQQQMQQYAIDRNDPDQIVAGTTITQQELLTLQEEQLRQYEQEKQDQNQVDPFTGLTAEETIQLHQQQLQLLKEKSGHQ